MKKTYVVHCSTIVNTDIVIFAGATKDYIVLGGLQLGTGDAHSNLRFE